MAESSFNNVEVFTTQEAAAYLRCSPASLENLRRANRGPKFYTLGPRLIRYRRADLDSWIEENVQKANVQEVEKQNAD